MVKALLFKRTEAFDEIIELTLITVVGAVMLYVTAAVGLKFTTLKVELLLFTVIGEVLPLKVTVPELDENTPLFNQLPVRLIGKLLAATVFSVTPVLIVKLLIFQALPMVLVPEPVQTISSALNTEVFMV
jgi:hypothetical protein